MPAQKPGLRRTFATRGEEMARRKRFLAATVVTCLGLAMIGGVLHVVKLGMNRLGDMRSQAPYPLEEVNSKVRAAGEDIQLHRLHKLNQTSVTTYATSELDSLLSPELWAQLDTMITIEGGTFLMGTDAPRANQADKPAHKVYVASYAIDKYPVTNAQYARFVSATGRRPPLNWKNGRFPSELAAHPVTMVSWYDAKAYAEWAGKRLVTEAEWEYAARGKSANRWPWGNRMNPKVVNTDDNRIGSTTPVNAFPGGASEFGVMDMAGNVAEWVADDFKPYKNSPASQDLFKVKIPKATSAADQAMKVVDLKMVDNIRYKVVRGGSWRSNSLSTSSYQRNYQLPNMASDFFGFRCAKSIKAVAGKADKIED